MAPLPQQCGRHNALLRVQRSASACLRAKPAVCKRCVVPQTSGCPLSPLMGLVGHLERWQRRPQRPCQLLGADQRLPHERRLTGRAQGACVPAPCIHPSQPCCPPVTPGLNARWCKSTGRWMVVASMCHKALWPGTGQAAGAGEEDASLPVVYCPHRSSIAPERAARPPWREHAWLHGCGCAQVWDLASGTCTQTIAKAHDSYITRILQYNVSGVCRPAAAASGCQQHRARL